jgi:ubiquinone biosynthesis protein Coq4
MRRSARTVRASVAGLRLLFDPTRLDGVFVVEEALLDDPRARAIVDLVRRDPRGARAIDDRVRLGPIDRPALRALPVGTLGRAYADFLDDNGLDPRAIPTLDAANDAAYVRAHLFETHDLWHVLTGFGTDVPGELAVQAVYLAQVHGALPPLLLTGGLIRALVFERESYRACVDAIARGYTLGAAARPLFGLRWGEMWERPLDEVRAELGVVTTVTTDARPR